MNTPAESQTLDELSSRLDKIVREYHHFKSHGQARRARSLAIEEIIPEALRDRENGDYNRWWQWLDDRLRKS
jgi:hypothetical protein